MYQVPVTVTDIIKVSRVVIDLKEITNTIPGGWEKCRDAFTHDEALAHGIDTWDCHGQCYTRLDGDSEYYPDIQPISSRH